MNTNTHNYLSAVLFLAVLVLGFGFPTSTQAAEDIPRIKISINEAGINAQPVKKGKLQTRQSGDRQTVRFKITPVETKDGYIRVIVPLSDLSEGVNVISVPARLLDSRGGEKGGKLLAR